MGMLPLPTAQAPLGRALPPFSVPPPAGPRHVDFAFWCQSLELSPPGLPSPAFPPVFPSGTGPFLEIGCLECEQGVQPCWGLRPSCLSVVAQPEPPDPSPPVPGSSHRPPPPGQHFCGDAVYFYYGEAFLVSPHIASPPRVPCRCACVLSISVLCTASRGRACDAPTLALPRGSLVVGSPSASHPSPSTLCLFPKRWALQSWETDPPCTVAPAPSLPCSHPPCVSLPWSVRPCLAPVSLVWAETPASQPGSLQQPPFLPSPGARGLSPSASTIALSREAEAH